MKHTPVSYAILSLILSAIFVVRFPLQLHAQADTAHRNAVSARGMVQPEPMMESPYAGKFEPRIGGWVESEGNKLRLDIGTAVDLWHVHPFDPPSRSYITLGTEFFTWTRLRSAGRFKFPVEAVDYYFGIFGNLYYHPFIGESSLNTKLRVAHISAHLVDGDSTFFGSDGKPVTYSREFIDLRTGLDSRVVDINGPFGEGTAQSHVYVGGVYLFSTIPDTLGRISPYAGLDFSWQLRDGAPLTVRAGYEARLNTELTPIGEHSVRLGVKLAETNKNGVVLEGAYYSGRSPYGQYFSRRESYFSFGFSVEH